METIREVFEITWEEINTVEEDGDHLLGLLGGVKIFKVTNYGGNWYAYFRPNGWKNFGNSVSKWNGNSNSFQNTNEAKKACIRHLATFGPLPSSFSHLNESPCGLR